MSWLPYLSKIRLLNPERNRRSTLGAAAASLNGCESYQEQLSAMMDDELSPEETARVEAHLADCLDCRQELESLNAYHTNIRCLAEVEAPGSLLGSIQEALRAEDAGSSCRQIGSLLSAYIDSEITLAERENVQMHTASCKGCAAQLKSLSRTSRLVRALPSIDPPAELRAQVLARTSRRSFRVPVFSVASLGLAAAAALCLYLSPAPPGDPGAPARTSPPSASAARAGSPVNASSAGFSAIARRSPIRGSRHSSDTGMPGNAGVPSIIRPGARIVAEAPSVHSRVLASLAPGFSPFRAGEGAPTPVPFTAAFPVRSIAAVRGSNSVLAAPARRPHRSNGLRPGRSGAELIPDSVLADPTPSWPGPGSPAALTVEGAQRPGSGGTSGSPGAVVAERPQSPDRITPILHDPPTTAPGSGTAASSPEKTPETQTAPVRHSELVLAAVQQSDLTDGVWSEDQTARNQRWTQTANMMVESTVHSSRLMSARRRGAGRSINGSPVLTAAASRPFQF